MCMGVEHRGAVTVIRAPQDIKLGEGDVALRQTVNEQLTQGRRQLLLDLSAVRFMDSSGIGAVVAVLKRVSEAGGRLKICRVNPRVSDVLSVTRLERVLEIYEDEKEALAAFH